MSELIQKAANKVAKKEAPTSVATMVGDLLDRENYRKRFDELLGARTPQFVASIVSLVNAAPQMQQAFHEAPITVIQSALRAASYDLPIDPGLGYAYIAPFYNNKKNKMEGTFILGWKGMHQLALRTGAYRTINVVDVREGELKMWNRLTEEIDLEFEEDETKRESLPVIGYVGFYKLINGCTKTIYRTVGAINAHEKANRKGDKPGWGWLYHWDSMARKTVYRELIGTWGAMSITYQDREGAMQLADAMKADHDLQSTPLYIDPDTGEAVETPETGAN